MAETPAWRVDGIYFEACNCELVCPCFSGNPPTYDICEGNCAWHVTSGRYGDQTLDGLNVIMVQHTRGFMRENPWDCWFLIDDRASDSQFEALKGIFTGAAGGHLGTLFRALWQVRGVERAPIEMELNGWQHRASVPGVLGLSVGRLAPEAGPTLCRVPNVPGVAALAAEDWYRSAGLRFDHQGKNALSTTFSYQGN